MNLKLDIEEACGSTIGSGLNKYRNKSDQTDYYSSKGNTAWSAITKFKVNKS